VTKSGFFVMEMSQNSPTSICSSKKSFRLASARQKGENREGGGEGEKEKGKAGKEKEGEAGELALKHKNLTPPV
jgi:hypothetical protein